MPATTGRSLIPCFRPTHLLLKRDGAAIEERPAVAEPFTRASLFRRRNACYPCQPAWDIARRRADQVYERNSMRATLLRDNHYQRPARTRARSRRVASTVLKGLLCTMQFWRTCCVWVQSARACSAWQHALLRRSQRAPGELVPFQSPDPQVRAVTPGSASLSKRSASLRHDHMQETQEP